MILDTFYIGESHICDTVQIGHLHVYQCKTQTQISWH